MDVLDLELAIVWGQFWAAAEILESDVDARDLGDPSFDGSYVQAGVFLTREHRSYKTSSGVFDRLRPRRDFDGHGGPGAWEIAVRYSTLDLTDGAIAGGELDSWSLALNWYVNPVTRLLLNWVHPDLEETGGADFLLVRAQIDF